MIPLCVNLCNLWWTVTQHSFQKPFTPCQTAFASLRILEVNPYHPLIVKLSEAVSDDALKAKVTEMVRVLYDQALIAEGEAIKDPSFFAERLSSYMLSAF